MQSPLALVLDDDPAVRARVRDALQTAGIEAFAAATPLDAFALLRAHPLAVVVAVVGEGLTPVRPKALEELCRLRANDGITATAVNILGRSQASEMLRERISALADSRVPVLFSGEPGSGRRHAARSLHALSNQEGPFVVVPAGEPSSVVASMKDGRGTVFVPSIEQLAWPAQEELATMLQAPTGRPRLVASIGIDPHRAVDEGRLSRSLIAAFAGAIVPVAPLRERRADIAVFVRSFVEELRVLNNLPPLAVAPEALAALERFAWPGNVVQLRGAIESAVMLATDGTVRLGDLPEHVVGGTRGGDASVRADRRFRDAKRVVVEAFERSYLEDLLRRHGGNVTGAAEQSGMLRSALQRLLRKHELHSADFRGRDASGSLAT